MYKKTISGLSIAAAALGLAAFSSPASADCTTDTDSEWECLEVEISPGSQTYTDTTSVNGMSGPYTFEGSASLQHWYVGTLNCTLTATGSVDVNPATNMAYVRVETLDSTGAGNCGLVDFGNLPIDAYEGDSATTPGLSGANHGDVFNKHGFDPSSPHSHNAFGTVGSTGASDRLAVIYDGTQVCNDSVDLEFGNDVNASGNKNNPSFFTFNTTMSGWAGSCTVNGTLTTDPGDDGLAPVYTDVNAW